jgi:diadenosine tetraphosphate (Ap4A) HIT family hydrolase
MPISAPMTPSNCPLCAEPGGLLIAQTALWRVVRVEDAAFPAFYRLVWQTHVAELSDLDPAHRLECMERVNRIELALRHALAPTKINLASFGNVVPHLHWHVIARFDWDSHYPQPVWGAAQREVPGGAEARLAVALTDLDARVLQELG